MLSTKIRLFNPASVDDYTIWKQLGLQWLQGYNHHAGVIPKLLEKGDFYLLDHPVENVIQQGGQIWFIEVDTKIAGTIGILPHHDEWEIIKLAVAPAFQGKGLAKILIKTVIEYSKKKGIGRLILDSNSSLVAAIHLYESFGFRHIPVTNREFATVDVAMELVLEAP